MYVPRNKLLPNQTY